MTVVDTARELERRVRARHAPNNQVSQEWVCVDEFTLPDGRRADLIAFNLWGSRGHAIHGYEFKVARSDFLKEIRDPSKAESLWEVCDYLWLVVGDKKIVRDGELPDGWGLMVPHGADSVRVVTKAKKTRAASLGREFTARFLKRTAVGMMPRKDVQPRLDKEFQRGFAAGERSAAHSSVRSDRQYEVLAEAARRLKEQTGIDLLSAAGYSGVREHKLSDLVRAHRLALELVNSDGRASVLGLLKDAALIASRMKERGEKLSAQFRDTADRLSAMVDGGDDDAE